MPTDLTVFVMKDSKCVSSDDKGIERRQESSLDSVFSFSITNEAVWASMSLGFASCKAWYPWEEMRLLNDVDSSFGSVAPITDLV
jgi:hypothetical protein